MGQARPIRYEGLHDADPKYYYTDLVDMVSRMYPSKKTMDEIENDPMENWPVVLCEYVRAMGNSCGDFGEDTCGPVLPEQYEIPRKGKNTFRFVF